MKIETKQQYHWFISKGKQGCRMTPYDIDNWWWRSMRQFWCSSRHLQIIGSHPCLSFLNLDYNLLTRIKEEFFTKWSARTCEKEVTSYFLALTVHGKYTWPSSILFDCMRLFLSWQILEAGPKEYRVQRSKQKQH